MAKQINSENLVLSFNPKFSTGTHVLVIPVIFNGKATPEMRITALADARTRVAMLYSIPLDNIEFVTWCSQITVSGNTIEAGFGGVK